MVSFNDTSEAHAFTVIYGLDHTVQLTQHGVIFSKYGKCDHNICDLKDNPQAWCHFPTHVLPSVAVAIASVCRPVMIECFVLPTPKKALK